ncbi:hypothetical protein E2C01_005572 [Portunus trituberculatus]|uniref:Uncharacterized protein n=1 Tax=Portunus trituberculatus TaxID=210409 RepID=A0A5B7CUN8_PORTR|nr:hypothetical protein [Portunus trituberculatus]
MKTPSSPSCVVVCVVAAVVTICYGAKPKLRGGLENSKCAISVSLRGGGVPRARLWNLRVVSARVTIYLTDPFYHFSSLPFTAVTNLTVNVNNNERYQFIS